MKNLLLSGILTACINFLFICSYSQGTFQSIATGSYTTAATWTLTAGADANGVPDADDDITILSGHTVTAPANSTQQCKNITINLGGQLTRAGTFVINGTTFSNSGTFASSGAQSLYFRTYAPKTISGAGSYGASGGWQIESNTTISANVTISKTDAITVVNTVTVTNNGKVTLSNNTLSVVGPSGKWINAAGSTLSIRNTLSGSGTVDATASTNTVTMTTTAGTCTVTSTDGKRPLGGRFNTLVLSGGAPKKLGSNLDVDGNLTCSTGGLNVNGLNMTIGGNWTQNSTVSSNTATCTFDGSSGAQTISGTVANISFANLTINNASGVSCSRPITVSGTNTLTSGVFTESSTLTYNGAAPQSITGGTGSITCPSGASITMSNASGVTTTQPMTIAGTINVTAGTFATGASKINVTSVAGTTGRIGDCTGGNITGTKWFLERYIASSDTGWQDISSPINGADISSWDSTLYMSLAAGCPDGLSGGWNSVYYWDVTGAGSWATVTSCSEPLTVGRGFEMWLASTTTTFVPTGTTRTIGTPNVGSKIITIGDAAAETALLGNPYMSPVSWTTMYGDNANVQNWFQVYDEVSGTYSIWNGSSGTGTGKLAASAGVIPAYQGFWVENLTATSTFTFNENRKVASALELVKQQHMPEVNILRMKIHSDFMPNAHESMICFMDGASEYHDGFGDVTFLPSREKKSPSLTPMSADNHKLTVSAFPLDKQSQDITIIANVSVPGDYMIDFKNVNLISAYPCLSLQEIGMNTVIPLKGDYTYHFTSHGDADSERKFILHCKKTTSGCYDDAKKASPDFRISPNDAGVNISFYFDKLTKANISAYNLLGQTLFNSNEIVSQNDITLPLAKTNSVYFIKIITEEGTITRKIIY
ncbi:MAG: T9SS type A sorting domain-containing protein [Bacteroidetes bacterium]|nr:T9SS type A sorting domain-containing protein [Bacteroidota bacterium]